MITKFYLHVLWNLRINQQDQLLMDIGLEADILVYFNIY